MSAGVPNFDAVKFRKVAALMTNGATDGERGAAHTRATVIAANAGLTLQQAMSKMDTPAKAKPASIFEGFDDWMEQKEPGYKAERAKKETQRQDQYAARREEILKEFGSVKAFLDPTPLECLLLKAGAPFVTKRTRWTDECGTRRQPASEFAGISGQFFKLADVAPAAVIAAKTAFPFPQTIRAAFEELRQWDQLNRDRAHFYDHHEYYFDLPVELRIELLRDAMKNQPVQSWDDLEARFHYKSYSWEQQWVDAQDFDDPEWSRLFADIQILRAGTEAAAAKDVSSTDTPPLRRTNADKRAAVLSILDTIPDLSDREIARRTGVSPQTVNNWRRRRHAV
jgi:hypothetical protein